MKDRIVRLFTHHKSLLLVFAGLLGVTLFFGVRTVVFAIYWMDPAHSNEPIEGWMTQKYVAMSYDLPPDVLGPALFLTADAAGRHQTLDQIAAQNGLTLSQLQDRILMAVAAFRAAHP